MPPSAAMSACARGTGKMVFELLPRLDWHKGKAVLHVLEALRLPAEVLPIYIGDDSTDEDAFAALAGRGRRHPGGRIAAPNRGLLYTTQPRRGAPLSCSA